MEQFAMRRLIILSAVLLSAAPAIAFDMPTRKAGLWEIKLTFDGRGLPPVVMKQCTDVGTDKQLNAQYSGAGQGACSQQDVKNSGAGMIFDSVCKFGPTTTTSHTVVTGSFDSAYTMKVSSTREGGPPMPGVAPGAETQLTIEGKRLGACEAGQKPGDVIMANGFKINVLDMPKPGAPPQRP
jgi:hypothetical protein